MLVVLSALRLQLLFRGAAYLVHHLSWIIVCTLMALLCLAHDATVIDEGSSGFPRIWHSSTLVSFPSGPCETFIMMGIMGSHLALVPTCCWDIWPTGIVLTSIGRSERRHDFPSNSAWMKCPMFHHVAHLGSEVVMRLASPLVILFYQVLLIFLCQWISLCHELSRLTSVDGRPRTTHLRSQARRGTWRFLKLAI